MFYQNSDFSFLGQVFQYCLLGLKSVSVEDRINSSRDLFELVRAILFHLLALNCLSCVETN